MEKIDRFAFLGALLALAVSPGCDVGTSGAASVGVDAAFDAGVGEDATTDATVDATFAEADVIQPEEVVIDAAGDAPSDGSGFAGLDSGGDATVDGSTCSASNCGGACCGDRCIAATCQGCGTGSLFCPYSATVPDSNGECVASCAACAAFGPGGGVTCFSCAGGPAVGTCTAGASVCPASTSAGACSCSAGSCPGATQVCASGDDDASICLTCGQAGTQGLPCATGQSCDQADSACEP